jgi:hypothetical protein
MSTKSLIIFVFVVLAFPMVSQQPGWRGIVPLRSSREDIEHLIGMPTKPDGNTYDLKDEKVNVTYSVVPCATGWPYGWDVPRGTVTHIEVIPKKKLKLSDLGLDIGKFRRFDNPEIGIDIHYTNDEEGFSIRTQNSEEVVSFEFFPALADRRMMCPEAAAREREIATGESTYAPPILRYYDASPNEERTRLEFLVDQLKNYPPGSQIYIIGYAGRESCPNEVLLRASRAKDCLLKLGISAQRIVTVNGGYKNDVWNEFFIVPPGDPKPLSTPDIYPKDVRVVTNCSKS